MIAIKSSGRTADANATTAGGGEARLRPFHQAVPFLFRAPREDRDEQVADRTARVEPALADADDLHADAIEFEDIGEG